MHVVYKMKRIIIFIISINSQLLFCSLNQSDNLDKNYLPVKIDGNIIIDGILDDDAWNNISYLSDFVQIDPFYKKNPNVNSKVKIVYNDNSIYFGILLYDDMSSIKFKLGEYDDWENTFDEDSDYFSIEIDSFNDQQAAFVFTINSSGVRADSKYYDGFYDDNWDGKWSSKVRLHNDMWIIEAEIPINNLKFNNHENLSMGINFLRYKNSSNTYMSWSEYSQNSKDDNLQYFGSIDKLNFKIENELIIHPIINHVNTKSSGYYYRDYTYDNNNQISGLDFSRPTTFNENFNNNSIGLDISYIIKSNLSFDLTLNPSFQNIQEDPAEVNTSSFETYHDENRPFFIINNSMFNTPINIYYSRRIGKEIINYQYVDNNNDPQLAQLYSRLDFASTLSGKNDKNIEYGLIFAQSKANDDLNIFGDEKVYYSVLRTKKKINKSNGFIGLMNTNYSFYDSYAHTYSLDGLLDLSEGLELSYQLVQSNVDKKTGVGVSYEIDYYSDVKLGPKYKYETINWFKYDRYDKDFNISNIGYLSRNDLESFNYGFAINFFEQKGNIVESKFVFQYIRDENTFGVTLDDIYYVEWYARLINNWIFNLELTKTELSYIDRFYDDYFYNNFYQEELVKYIKKSPKDNIVISLNSDSRRKVSFTVMWNYFINDIKDDGRAKEVALRFKPTDKLDFGFSFYDLSFYKTYYFLKIRMIPAGNDHIIHNFSIPSNQLSSRNDYEYLFTNSNNKQKVYSFNMLGHIKNNFSIQIFVEYFMHNDNWIGNNYSIKSNNQSNFIFPEEDNSFALDDDDRLLYLSKYTSLLSNINFNWEITDNAKIVFGYIYNKQINGLILNKLKDLLAFKASHIDGSNKAELFFDETFFIKYEFNI